MSSETHNKMIEKAFDLLNTDYDMVINIALLHYSSILSLATHAFS
jgi:hypothetical protein